MQNTTIDFQIGDAVAVENSKSAFAGWIGTVVDPDRGSRIVGRMIAVDFEPRQIGRSELRLTRVPFMPRELAKV